MMQNSKFPGLLALYFLKPQEKLNKARRTTLSSKAFTLTSGLFMFMESALRSFHFSLVILIYQ